MSGDGTNPAPDLPFAPAAERNKRPILDALRGRLPDRGRLLEIGAGTGQHAVFLAAHFPALEWLPTEVPEQLPGLRARVAAEGPANLLAPRGLDVCDTTWPQGPFEAVYSANTAHIMPWAAVLSMLEGVGRCLAPGGVFLLYGPFMIDGRHNAPSNEAFHRALRAEDPRRGLRDLAALESAAAHHHLRLEERAAVPTNNFLLLFRREARHSNDGSATT